MWSNWFIQSKFHEFELLSYFDALRLLNFRSHYCLAPHHELTQCSNFQGGFSNPWTFHNIAGLRLYDAAGIYKELWSWLWQRKCCPQHAEVPGHCQWIECWRIMLCPACFSRTTNCSPLFCTLICSRSSGPFGPPIHVPPRSEATKWRTGNDDNDGGIDLASCRVWWRATNGPSSRHNMSQVSNAFAKTINKKQNFARKNKQKISKRKFWQRLTNGPFSPWPVASGASDASCIPAPAPKGESIPGYKSSL